MNHYGPLRYIPLPGICLLISRLDENRGCHLGHHNIHLQSSLKENDMDAGKTSESINVIKALYFPEFKVRVQPDRNCRSI